MDRNTRYKVGDIVRCYRKFIDVPEETLFEIVQVNAYSYYTTYLITPATMDGKRYYVRAESIRKASVNDFDKRKIKTLL